LREIASSKPGSSHSGRWVRLGDALVVVQVALSIVVLIGAGLLVRSLRNLETINPGFETRNVLLFGLNPNSAGYKDRQTTQLYDNLQQRLAALPSVTSVSYSGDALVSGSWSSGDVHLDSAAPKDNFNTATLAIGLDFFSTMKIPMLTGRSFSPSDFAAASEVNAAQRAEAAAEAKLPPGTKPQPVSPSAPKLPAVPVLINQTFANKAFPNQDPLGRHIGDEQTDDPETLPLGGYRVIGVVGDTKYNSLRKEIVPTMYTPLTGNSAHFELRTTGDPMALAQLVRTTLAKVDANLPIFAMRTQTEQVQETLFHDRLLSKLFGFFALLALVLACVGLYGLLSLDVTRRTREIGIRVALGARRLHLFRLVVRQGIVLVLAGAVLGIGAAIGITRFMTGMLYNVHATDPVVFVGVFALLILVALVACAIPARRALGVDPIVALREE
jgi:predicted permease